MHLGRCWTLLSTHAARLRASFRNGRNPDHQVDALRGAGVATEHIHIDRADGAKASRPQLDLVLRRLREGDTLVITRLDRLGRSVPHLITLGAEGRAMFGM